MRKTLYMLVLTLVATAAVFVLTASMAAGAAPPDTSEPVVTRGSQVVMTNDDLPDGQCFVPDHQVDEYFGLNHIPCEDVTPAPVSIGTATTVVASFNLTSVSHPTELPATGSGDILMFVGGLLLFMGSLMILIAATKR